MSWRTLAHAEVMRVGKFASVNPFMASRAALLCQATPLSYIQKIPTAAVASHTASCTPSPRISLSVICWLPCRCQRPVITRSPGAVEKEKLNPGKGSVHVVRMSHWCHLVNSSPAGPRLQIRVRRERSDACWECSAVRHASVTLRRGSMKR